MDNKEIFKIHSEFCKSMGNPKRLEILFRLGKKEMCVDDIASEMQLRVPNVSQHLAIMREKGIVEVRRDGTRMYYNLVDPKILEACTMIREVMVVQMEKKLNTFK